MADDHPHFPTFYIHVQRMFDALGPSVAEHFGPVPVDHLERGRYYSLLSEEFIRALERSKPPTLGEALIRGELRPGLAVTHYGAFFCRGVGQYLDGKRSDLPDMYAKLDDLRPNLRALATLGPKHFTATSAAGTFKGQQRLFTSSVVAAAGSERIDLKLIAAGLLVPDLFGNGPSIRMPVWHTMGEVRPYEIDAFASAADEPNPTAEELPQLLAVPERDIKHTFAEIIGEPYVHPDWPGETSDLYTSRVSVAGRPFTASFLLKGPARFHPMKYPDLGKMGDQIVRLFNDPSDLLVVQHCHEITPAIRATMRAFANQIGRARMYCVIDGLETLRILQANGKLGFTSRRANRPARNSRE